jgi:hypothetical protein
MSDLCEVATQCLVTELVGIVDRNSLIAVKPSIVWCLRPDLLTPAEHSYLSSIGRELTKDDLS